MTTATRTYTIAEFMRLPDPDDGGRYELVNGVIVHMSPASGKHGRIAMNVIRALDSYVIQRDLGDVFSTETGFLIDPFGRTVRAPDVAFVAKGRLKPGDEESYIPFEPDLAVEVVSPSDSSDAVDAKTQEYQQAGVRLVWIIFPRRNAIYAYHPDTDITTPRIYRMDDMLDGEIVVPGFKMTVSAVFKAQGGPIV